MKYQQCQAMTGTMMLRKDFRRHMLRSVICKSTGPTLITHHFIVIVYLNAVLLRMVAANSVLPKQPLKQALQRMESVSIDQPYHDVSQMQDDSEYHDETFLHLTPFHEVIGTHLLNAHSYRCEPIVLALCKGMYYQQTRMPNFFQHETQEEAGLEAHQFYPLVQINCSEDLRFFLCSIYTPICIKGYPSFLPPCRSVCERVRAGCAPVMQHYNFPWPQRLNCAQFPEYNNPKQVLCMERNLTEFNWKLGPTVAQMNKKQQYVDSASVTEPRMSVSTNGPVRTYEHEANSVFLTIARNNETLRTMLDRQSNLQLKCACNCRPPLIKLPNREKPTDSKVSTTIFEDCERPCHSTRSLSDAPQPNPGFTTVWLAIWAVLCGISALLTMITFFLNSNRIRFPELAIVYLAACYFMVSLGYMTRVILGHDAVACDMIQEDSEPIVALDLEKNLPSIVEFTESLNHTIAGKANDAFRLKVLRYASTGRVSCATVFVFIYFFSLAGDLWWVILTMTWFLIFGLRWGSEVISKYSQVFHFVVWSVPTGMTALALMTTVTEGDPISGLCVIGTRRRLPYILLQFLPKILFLTAGVVFLAAGFCVIFCIQKNAKAGDTANCQKGRTVIFALTYFLLSLILLMCSGYELQNSRLWELGHACDCNFVHSSPSNENAQSLPSWESPKPSYALFMIKHFMTLFGGMTSFLWIWSNQTSNSWLSMCTRLRLACMPHKGLIPLLSDQMEQEGSSKVLLISYRSNMNDKNLSESAQSSTDSGGKLAEMNGAMVERFSVSPYENSSASYLSANRKCGRSKQKLNYNMRNMSLTAKSSTAPDKMFLPNALWNPDTSKAIKASNFFHLVGHQQKWTAQMDMNHKVNHGFEICSSSNHNSNISDRSTSNEQLHTKCVRASNQDWAQLYNELLPSPASDFVALNEQKFNETKNTPLGCTVPAAYRYRLSPACDGYRRSIEADYRAQSEQACMDNQRNGNVAGQRGELERNRFRK